MKHASMWGAINEWFGTLEELSFGSAWGSAHIETMSKLGAHSSKYFRVNLPNKTS